MLKIQVTCLFLTLVIIFSISLQAVTLDKAVYTPDDRKFIENYKGDQIFANFSHSVAAQIDPKSYIIKNGQFFLKSETLEESLNVCPEERFSKEIAVANCTGFLIAPDLLVTAGHCLGTTKSCNKKEVWIFDYTRDELTNAKKNDGLIEFKNSNVFKCIDVLEHHYHPSALVDIEQNDYAIIKLDRVVERDYLQIRDPGSISMHERLVTIGHPSGLGTVIADNASVNMIQHRYYFMADLDAIEGNSGGPVFNEETKKIEGIVVRSGNGTSSYRMDRKRDCRKLNIVDHFYGGTSIGRINSVPNLQKWIIDSYKRNR